MGTLKPSVEGTEGAKGVKGSKGSEGGKGAKGGQRGGLNSLFHRFRAFFRNSEPFWGFRNFGDLVLFWGFRAFWGFRTFLGIQGLFRDSGPFSGISNLFRDLWPFQEFADSRPTRGAKGKLRGLGSPPPGVPTTCRGEGGAKGMKLSEGNKRAKGQMGSFNIIFIKH